MAIANPWSRLSARTRKVLRTIAISITAVLLIIAVASVGLVAWLISGVGRLDEVAEGPGAGAAGTADPIYLLMVRDTRLNQTAASADVGRTDSMALIRLKEGVSIDVVQLPRDLLVDIPSCPLPGGGATEPITTKLNAAYAYASVEDPIATPSAHGAACAKRTVEELVGFDIAGAAVLDIAAVGEIVDGLGGVELCATVAQASGFAGVQPGCQDIDGDTAVRFARTRVGVQDDSDISRLERQRALLTAVAAQLRRQSLPGDLPKLMGLVRGVGGELSADAGMVTLGNANRVVRTLKGGRYTVRRMPVESAGDGVNLVPGAGADGLWRAMRAGERLPNVED